MMKITHYALVLLASVLINHLALAQNEVDIIVHSEEKQTFLGLGASIHTTSSGNIPNTEVKKESYDVSFATLKNMVFWSYIENPEIRDEVVKAAQKSGLQRIIVNSTNTDKNGVTERFTGPNHLASKVFGEIEEYIKAGYPVYGTTILNKPNTDESDTFRETPEFVVQSAILLRKKLDSAGYNDVKIGGPNTIEWDPYIDPTQNGAAHGYGFQKGDNMLYLNAFLNDSLGLASLDAFDFQSYGWSINKEIEQLAKEHGKDLWISLAALDGKDNSNWTSITGLGIAANCIANLNHGVSMWNHWVWNQLISLGSGNLNYRMKFLQQIAANIEEGAVFRQCEIDESQPSRDMFWNFYDIENPENNKQPDIVATSAVNPDSTLSIAIVNVSGLHIQHFASVSMPNENKTYKINFEIKDLRNIEKLISIVSLVDESGEVTQYPIEIKNGKVQLTVLPQNMVILKTFKFAPELLVTNIEIEGEDILVNNGTTELSANFLPLDATNPSFTWKIIGETLGAKIDSLTGVVTASGFTAGNGTIIIRAHANDGSGLVSDDFELVISGQGADALNAQVVASSIDVSFYPNPFKSQTTCRFNLKSNADVLFEIYNASGQRVYFTEWRGMKAGVSHKKLAELNIQSGLYYGRITVRNGESKTTTVTKLIVNQ